MNERLGIPDTEPAAKYSCRGDAQFLADCEDLIGIAVDGCQAAGAALYVPRGNHWSVQARVGMDGDVSPAMEMALHGPAPAQLLICEDMRVHAAGLPPWLRSVPDEAAACAAVPVRNDAGECAGLLLVMDKRPRPFDQHHLSLLQRVARRILRLFELDALRSGKAEADETNGQPRPEERFARVFQVSPDPIAIVALDDGRFCEVNGAFLRVTGCPREEVIGRTAEEVGVSWVDPTVGIRIAEILRTERTIHNIEIKLRLRSGKIWLGLLSAEVIEIDGRPCLLSVAKDISEIRRLEEQLLQAQKMDAIGRLAGGIAHDFNNFLTIIHGYSEVLLTQVIELPEAVRGPILEMRTAAERAAGLTRQLLAFSRQQILRLQDVDLNRVVESNERMLRSAISERIDLRLKLDPLLGRVQADPSQIDQVILNLVINARDAMPGGGSTLIETSNVQFSDSTLFGRDQVPPGRWICFSVTDTGHGMNDVVQSRIFEPFYTTKEEGHGTGLGLATVYGIVKQSGGYIAVTSTPEVGTKFEILLPRFDAPVPAGGEEPAMRTPLEGTETILLVEDEEAIRLLCQEVLEGQGYTVLVADNGEDALRVANGTGDPIHLLIADLVLPWLSGDALATTLRQQRPAMAVIFMSGMSDDRRHMNPPPAEETPFLQKPFSPARLSRMVRDLLDRSSPERWVQ